MDSNQIRKCFFFWVLSAFIVYSQGNLSSATDTIPANASISDGQTLTSAGGRFRLGFFSPTKSSSNRYVGIWYNLAVHELMVVWVANRENPVNDTSGVLKFDGVTTNLILVDGRNQILWSTNVNHNRSTALANVSAAKLMDSGNLVLLHADATIIWKSFDHLTDTLLPGAEMFYDWRTKNYNTLVSWKSKSDPSPGSYSLGMLPSDFYQGSILVNGSIPHWRSGPWIGQKCIGVPGMPSGYWDGFILNRGANNLTYRYVLYNDSILTRVVLDPGGQLSYWWWDEVKKELSMLWKKPEDQCDLYGTCGDFGLCNSSSSPICSCIRGFEPRSKENWANDNWSDGCVRINELACKKNQSNNVTGGDGFFKLARLKIPDLASWINENNERDCRWRCSANCHCLAYAFVESNCMIWKKELLDMMVFPEGGEGLNIKVNPSDLKNAFEDNSSGSNRQKKVLVMITLVVALGTACVSCLICFRKYMGLEKKNEPNEFIKTGQAPVLGVRELADALDSTPSEIKGLDSLLYDMGKIITATGDFNVDNKLGEGGFGTVYKGVLPGGKEIAVKRLSAMSRQGLKEFKTEVLLISKLQHRNLVRLLGYCINVEEKLLIYEYLPNKSLDAYLFGALKENLLDWSKRFHIIEGIAQGLLYLHRDSRLRIIHRDLKASNILLDADLNPKISDFGTARIFGVDQILETNTIVGTHGYMSPEYAMQGHFSEKSDVYSLGVLILEIISSERISSFYDDLHSLNLLGYSWKFWEEGNAFELVDLNLRDSWPQSNAMKCITVALLCVQELAADRPTMSSVISMLISENAGLPTPKRPAFVGRTDPWCSKSMEDKKQNSSMCGLTLTELESR